MPLSKETYLGDGVYLLRPNYVDSLFKVWRQSDSEQMLNLGSFHSPLETSLC